VTADRHLDREHLDFAEVLLVLRLAEELVPGADHPLEGQEPTLECVVWNLRAILGHGWARHREGVAAPIDARLRVE